MRASHRLVLLLGCAVVGACSKPSDAPATAAASNAAVAASPAQAAANPAAASTTAASATASAPASAKACEMVTAKEMSAILGSDVGAQPNEGSSGKTQCTYTAVKGVSPYVELSVEWGEGEDAMAAAGTMSKDMVNPYEGIGDQAVAVGTVLMIRTGHDLMTITFSGVKDAPAAAKKIFDTAKSRM